MGHRQVLHPASTLRKLFVKLISLLRDRYGPRRKTRDHSPDPGGVAGKPRVEERHGANSPRLRERVRRCRLVEVAAAQAEHGPELGLEASSVFPRAEDGEITSVRRSPKRAGVVEVFDKLVAFPSLFMHPHLTIDALLVARITFAGVSRTDGS